VHNHKQLLPLVLLLALALTLPTSVPDASGATDGPWPGSESFIAAERLDTPQEEPVFWRGALDVAIVTPTSLSFGPDGRLYVASWTAIQALTLDAATQQVLAVEQIASGLVDVLGLAFDPTAPASPVTIYASGREATATAGFDGVVSTFTAPNWAREDVITGLPSSRPSFNHLTNGLAFDAQGRLFIAQGSSTDSGLVEEEFWPETPLSAAILVAEINQPDFDGAVSYQPPGSPADDNVDQVGGDVAVYAPGLRNPYDLVVHSNGHIYATDNGASGPQASDSCQGSAFGVSASDELNLIEQGSYYGQPNRNRGRSDPRQCIYHAPEEGDGADFTAPIAILPRHCSCDGIAEYTGAAFGGTMLGNLVYVRWNLGSIARAELSADGRSVLSTSTLASGLGLPLDVTVGPDGTIYIAEFGEERIAYLAPDSDRDGCADSREAGAEPGLGGGRDPKDFWDFFDTPDLNATPQRDRQIGIADIFRVAGRFGATGDPSIDPLSTPPEAGYHPAYDRTTAPPGGSALDIGPADGAITIGDIFAAATQFGHACA
jgi:glucose/arabinose dehydrogenase